MRNIESNLLKEFNARKSEAFGEVYSLFYNEMYYIAFKLLKGTSLEARDTIHDIFLKLWQSNSIVFDDILDIKAYIYVSLRNSVRSFMSHQKHVVQYEKKFLVENDEFETYVIESELFSNFHYILGLLPEDSAEILRLFFSGWSPEEISLKMGKNIQTIYNKKSEALSTLKKKLSKNDFFIFLMIID